MGDTFKEQLVKKKSSRKDMIIRGLIILGALVISVLVLSIEILQGFSLFIILAVFFAAFYFISMSNIEYEYIFTNGEFDIDCIYNKNRRKRIFSGNTKEFEIMAHVEDKNHISDFRSAAGTLECGSGVIGKDSYAFLASYKGKRLKVIIEPNEMMQAAFRTALSPRKFIKREV